MLDHYPIETRNWSWPTAIRFGAGRLAELPQMVRELGAQNPLFVTDVALAPLPVTQGALSILHEAGLRFGLFAEVEPNPTGAVVDAGLAAYRTGGHDMVIAFGGGSALDAGKAIALMTHQTRPIWDFEDIGDNWKNVTVEDHPPVIAIPTTAGTGSELGRSSIITDGESHRKLIIFHPIMMPQIAILDPEVTLGLPPALTASTGMDALCHALECYITPGFHPMADGLALHALQLIHANLPRAYADGSDIEARAAMLVASGMACVALQKGLGGVHALSHSLGAVYDLPHGLLNAVLLPLVTEFNLPVAQKRLEDVARLLALPGGDAGAVVHWLAGLRDRFAIPSGLKSLGVDERRLDDLVALTLRDPCAPANPTRLDAENVRGLLLRAMQQ